MLSSADILTPPSLIFRSWCDPFFFLTCDSGPVEEAADGGSPKTKLF